MPFPQEEFDLVRSHDCRAELDFLLAAADRRYAPAAPPHGQGRDPVDPIRLFELARLNKMVNFLPSKPRDLPPGCESLAPRIDAARIYTLALNRRGLTIGMRLSRLLHDAGIAHLHIKGPLQQVTLYGCYFQKPSADIDILVPPRQRRQAAQIIKAESFVQLDSHIAIWWQTFLNEIHLLHREDGVLVDLHHGLQQAGLPRPHRQNEFFDQRSVMTFEGSEFQVPSPPHRVLIAAISLGKAFLAREPALSSILDLRAAIARLTPAELRALEQSAATVGLEQTLGLARRMLAAFFPESTPALPGLGQPLPALSASDLRQMVATPWRDGIPWPRRHRLMAELCGSDALRYSRETLRSMMSEALRKTLEHVPHRRGLAR